MYFSSRMQAGRMLASMMEPDYRYENCSIVALDDGGVVVGAQIAMRLHCIITMMVMQEITLPRELKPIAGIGSGGKFTYNREFSDGEIDEMVSEYHGYLEEERLHKFQELNRLLGSDGLMSTKILKHHTVILVSDGLQSTIELDMAAELIKPIAIDKLIVATPFASVPVIDRVHVMADAVFCLDVIDEPFETAHYYDKNDIPDHNKIIKTIENIILKWK